MTETPQHDRVHTENLRDYGSLRRSLTDRKVAGVAGGLGRHLNIDPTILRVVFVVLCFFGGAGFVLYGAAWLLVPEEGRDDAVISTNAATRNVLLIGAAAVAGLLLIGDSWGGYWFPWPLAIVALIVFAFLMNRDNRMNTQNPPGQWTGAPGGTTTAPAPDEAGTEQTTEYVPQHPAPPWTPPTQQAYQPPAPKPDRGPKLFWITLALVAIGLGTLGLYDVAGGPVVAGAYPALGLTIVGAMLVLGAWVGRAGGLIFLGIVAAIALAVTSLANVNYQGGRTIDVAPFSAAQVRDNYSVPAGTIHVDLSNVTDIDSLDGRTIDLNANAGEIVVTVPDGVDLDIEADVDVGGEADVLGQQSNGTNVHIDRRISAGSTDAPDLELDIQLLVGSIEVRQS